MTTSSYYSYSSPPFLEQYLNDSLDLPDFYSLASLLRIQKREAERLVIKHKERAAGCRIRDLFCTKETRELRREILEMLSLYAVTRIGKEMILTLIPTQNREELQRRFTDIRAGIELVQLLGAENVKRVREMLSKVEIRGIGIFKAPVVAVQDREIEQLIKANYGDFVTVEFLDSVEKAEELVNRENSILLIGGREHEYDEPGIITKRIDDLSEPCEICPEFVVRSYVAKKSAIEVLIEILEHFEAIKNSELFKDVPITELKAVLSLISVSEAEVKDKDRDKDNGAESFDEKILRYEEQINREAVRIMKTGGGAAEFRAYLDDILLQMADELMLKGEDSITLRESVLDLEAGELPFEFRRDKIGSLRLKYNRERGERSYYRLCELAKQLEQHREVVREGIKKLFYLDFMLATALFARDFELNPPELIDGGLGLEMGKNIFLKAEELKGGEKVIPVSYSIGEVKLGIFGATPHPVAILTGANSGGKTCLLNMLATSVILTELGLPVPAERAEIPLLPLYLYRRKMIKKTGSFEYSMRALGRIFMREGGKVVLIDELEALTEPGAMGRIMASILNNLPEGTLGVVITHLIHEILPHISMAKIRVDGIESEGLDASGNIIVDRQPMFNHIGSSMPELVIKKLLGRVKNVELRTVYEEIIDVLANERAELGSKSKNG
ncbi:MAG: hypothetical protein OCU20_05420 [Methanophagales archaeon]|nr:hypothetical protein [Methanophagales archaeon]